MRAIRGLALGALCFGYAVFASAQTNLQFLAHPLNIGLTAFVQGTGQTNGIIEKLSISTVRVSSKDLIQALANKPVFALSKALTNIVTLKTNHVSGTNVVTTNVLVTAIPVFTPVTVPSYSPKAKLQWFQPAGTNALGPLVTILDGEPLVAYDVSAYFRLGSTNFDGRTNGHVTSAAIDVSHNLIAGFHYGIQSFAFDANAFSAMPPTGLYFDLQGFSREVAYSVVKGKDILAARAMKSAVSTLSGTGQLGTNRFAVFRGQLLVAPGKWQTW